MADRPVQYADWLLTLSEGILVPLIFELLAEWWQCGYQLRPISVFRTLLFRYLGIPFGVIAALKPDHGWIGYPCQ